MKGKKNTPMKLALIAAVAYDNVIGADGRTPFKVEGDLPRFKKLTLNHPIIMGRKTYQSIGRPLPTRTNIVVSRTNSLADVLVAHTLDEALELAEGHIPEDQTAYVIGGGEIYRATIGIHHFNLINGKNPIENDMTATHL